MVKLNERTGLKRCSQCREELPRERFARCLSPNASVLDGLTTACKDCRNSQARERRRLKPPRTRYGRIPKNREGEWPGSRLCIECKQSLSTDEFYVHKQRPDGLDVVCKTCVKQRRRQFHATNKNRVNPAYTRYRRRLRFKVLMAYGGKCACCGECRPDFLCIDHEKGGGNAHRRSIRATSATSMDRWLILNDFPSGFRVLCHNCNLALAFYGHCPHESGRSVFDGIELEGDSLGSIRSFRRGDPQHPQWEC